METAQNKLLKQMMDFQQSALDRSYHSMTALQEQGKKMVDLSIREKRSWQNGLPFFRKTPAISRH